MPNFARSLCAVALSVSCLSNAPMAFAAQTISADIVITGGSFGAPAAALAAARANPSAAIVLVEPTDWLGGQATSQGVSAIDNAWHPPAQALMNENRTTYYPADYLEFLNRMRNTGPSVPGEGLSPEGTSWVSREAYDPRTGAWALDQMVAAYPNIRVLKMAVVKAAAAEPVTDAYGSAKNITSLTVVQRTPKPGYVPFTKFLSEELPDWYSRDDSADFAKEVVDVVPANPARGMVVIDASETADAIVLSGADYVVGREKTTETVSAAGQPPEHYENFSQATVFPFCMTDAASSASEAALKTPWADFESFYQDKKSNYFGFGQWSWERIWTYRRLKTTGPAYRFDNVYRGDVTMQNWYPGNDYPDKSIYLSKADTGLQLSDWSGGLDLSAVAGAEKIARAFYFYMKERNTQPWDTRYLLGDDPLNMMDTPHGLSKFPYIRCGRRILGLQNFRLLQRYLLPATTGADAKTSYRFYDSVAIGSYAMDSHAVAGSKGVTHGVEKPAPFYLPYRAIASGNVRNLLSGCKSFAGTYWTNSAYRLHPIEWSVGSAAGVAAAHMSSSTLSNIQMLELPHLRKMQQDISKNSPIHWKAFDASPVPPRDGDLIVNDLKSVMYNKSFPIQIYSLGSTRAEIFLNGQRAGETTTRVNDHLLFDNVVATTNPLTVEARCYNSSGTLVTTLTLQVPVIGVPNDPYIVDNSDPRFSVTGAWQTGTGQADKYGTDYRFADGTGGLKKATWKLNLPAAGEYQLYVWYPMAANRAIDAPFTVFHAGGSTTVKINQRIAGGQWVPLGKFAFNTVPTERVELTNQIAHPLANTNYVLADAVRSQPVPPAGVDQWTSY